MNHTINITPWKSNRPALAAHFDWTCSCGKRASRPAVDRNAAEGDAIRHTPQQNTITRHQHH
jgi:hypothetical protein